MTGGLYFILSFILIASEASANVVSHTSYPRGKTVQDILDQNTKYVKTILSMLDGVNGNLQSLDERVTFIEKYLNLSPVGDEPNPVAVTKSPNGKDSQNGRLEAVPEPSISERQCNAKGGRLVANECFSLHIDKNDAGNYKDSQRFCERRGGYLAEPSNLERLFELAPSVWPDLQRDTYWYVWLGVTKHGHPGSWKWSHSGKDLHISDKVWASGESSKIGTCASLFWPSSPKPRQYGIERVRVTLCSQIRQPVCQYY